MDIGETLDLVTPEAWRAWLEAHHASRSEIWLVYHSKASGRPGIAYNAAVDEAMCFGWIDSTVKKLGPTSRAQRFTPRRPGSPISEMNKARLRRLAAANRLLPAVLEAVQPILDEPYEIPPDILDRLQADAETWRNFQALPESYRRIRIGFIEAARNRPEIFEKRMVYFLKMTAQNKRYGMVQ